MQFANLSDLHAGRPKLAHNDNITNNLAVGVNGGGSSTLTFDANGNMTSDGTNTYSWDAESRLTRITYPGTNNFSDFSFDGFGRNVKIVETTSGSITSTRQFIWGKRRSEERDIASTVTKKFFSLGETSSGIDYLYSSDRLGSIREVRSTSLQSQRSYDPFGRSILLDGTSTDDFQYAGYFVHQRSGLPLTRTRALAPMQGRSILRDRIYEKGGVNLYAYAKNNPINLLDHSGQAATPRPKKKCPKNPAPEFEDCKPGDVECCGRNFTKCTDACDVWYGPDGIVPNPDWYQECVGCCVGKYDACLGDTGPDPYPGSEFQICLDVAAEGAPPGD